VIGIAGGTDWSLQAGVTLRARRAGVAGLALRARH